MAAVAATVLCGITSALAADVNEQMLTEMMVGQKIELNITVTLSNGQILSAFGGNWFYTEEAMLPAGRKMRAFSRSDIPKPYIHAGDKARYRFRSVHAAIPHRTLPALAKRPPVRVWWDEYPEQ